MKRDKGMKGRRKRRRSMKEIVGMEGRRREEVD